MEYYSNAAYVGYAGHPGHKPLKINARFRKRLFKRLKQTFSHNPKALDSTLEGRIIELHINPSVKAYQEFHDCLEQYRLGTPLSEFWEFAMTLESAYAINFYTEWLAYYSQPVYLMGCRVRNQVDLIERLGLNNGRLKKLIKLRMKHRAENRLMQVHIEGRKIFVER